ncbi:MULTISPECIES: DEAD/DEAH box helicase [Bacillus]|uniref:DEAD/DEAH box helicase n=1 Tax=Bacillus TaxID=1386 RepID=UPI0002FB4990|nr:MULTISPECIES: DEAD/DEAH box helicase [Bacillus]
MPDFISLGLSDDLVEKLVENQIKEPTKIQIEVIPTLLDGQDLIGQAQTGTGKTLAFLLPILDKIQQNKNGIQALIVTPTRELALQITNEIEKVALEKDNLHVLPIYGGQDVEKQIKRLNKNIHIVVATPGRLLDHIRRETIDLSTVSFLVLDEADQMLQIGFLKEVEKIISHTSLARQTMLFSATMTKDVQSLAKKHMNHPKFISVESFQGTADTIKQLAIYTSDRAKQPTLLSLLEEHRPFLAVVFCRTKRRVTKLTGVLKSNGIVCDELHSDLSQAKRERIMKLFRSAKLQILVATDVAARGLDVEGVTHVYNYDMPEDTESYIHRIGRTGRAGSEGLAVTFYNSDDLGMLNGIERELKINLEKQKSEFVKEEVDIHHASPSIKKKRNQDSYSKKRPKKTVSARKEESKKRDTKPLMAFGNSYSPSNKLKKKQTNTKNKNK